MNSSQLSIDKINHWQSQLRLIRLASQVAAHAQPQGWVSQPEPGKTPLVLFNATARIHGLSQNAAFAFLTASGLRLAGYPVIQFVCQAGMKQCVLGVNRENYYTAPPCQACIRQSKRIYYGADVHWAGFDADEALENALSNLNVEQLASFEREYTFTPDTFTLQSTIPLGKLILPAVRWTLRRHTLPDDEPTRYLMRSFIVSAYSIAQEFGRCLDETRQRFGLDPTAVIFNGIMYPEATARWVAQQRGLRVITHEVGFQRFSAFFTDGDATAYPIPVPEDFELNDAQNARLDAYLEKRFQGQFSMAGIHFWPEMQRLDDQFLEKASRFRQIVPVFTNVIYDTSQVHANQVFETMFAWLDAVQELIRSHPETLFVIRAHPDEERPGTAKISRETVQEWLKERRLDQQDNVVFIAPQEYISSYELIQRARFVMVYNSSIGLEASLLGAPVLCAGKARYTQYPIVFFPQSPLEFMQTAQNFLAAEKIDIPAEFQRNARRFLFYQLYRASLSFEDYLQESPRKGFANLRPTGWRNLLPDSFPALQVILTGLQQRIPFQYPKDFERGDTL